MTIRLSLIAAALGAAALSLVTAFAQDAAAEGASMAFAGLKKDEDRKNLVAYLAGFDESGASR